MSDMSTADPSREGTITDVITPLEIVALTLAEGAAHARKVLDGLAPMPLPGGNWEKRCEEAGLQMAEWARRGVTAVTAVDDRYPTKLRDLDAPPPVLWVRGDAAALGEGGVAIVGTRQPTTFGLSCADTVAEAAVEAARVVHSGLALGIDICGHRGAYLRGGRTVAWVADCVLSPSPAEHRADADKIVEAGGAIVSENPPGTERTAGRLLGRNRLIVAAADVVVVAQTKAAGGTMGAVSDALLVGRPIYCPDPGGRASAANDGLRLLLDGAAWRHINRIPQWQRRGKRLVETLVARGDEPAARPLTRDNVTEVVNLGT